LERIPIQKEAQEVKEAREAQSALTRVREMMEARMLGRIEPGIKSAADLRTC
jgi:hypothetical protein